MNDEKAMFKKTGKIIIPGRLITPLLSPSAIALFIMARHPGMTEDIMADWLKVADLGPIYDELELAELITRTGDSIVFLN